MKLNGKGQVTIPADIRAKYGLREGDEVAVIDTGDGLQLVPAQADLSRGQRAVARLRGSASTDMTTDEIMALLRDG